MSSVSLLIGLGCLCLLGVVWWWTGQMQTAVNLPTGKIIYTDNETWFPNTQPLIDEKLQLVGKPDYLIERQDGMIVPVELKSGRAPRYPHDGHVMQLMAYCLLVETAYGVRPDYGVIQYQDRAFSIEFTEELEENLLDILVEMREAQFTNEQHRSHTIPPRCASCGVRDFCDQRLS